MGMHPFKFDHFNPRQLEVVRNDYMSLLAMNEIVICCDKHKKIEWEIKIVERLSHCIYFMFGFVEYPTSSSIQKWNTHFGNDPFSPITNDEQFGVWISSGDRQAMGEFYLYGRHK